MTYDQWKTRSPDDDYWDDDDPREDDCDHDDYEADILTGIAMCHRCGHRWMQTNEEIAREIEHQAEYQRMQDRWNREQWWRDRWEWIRSFFPQRRQKAAEMNDEIPF